MTQGPQDPYSEAGTGLEDSSRPRQVDSPDEPIVPDEQRGAGGNGRDTDADPDNLNPRTGSAAARQPGEERYQDTDANPANLNPRTGDAAGEPTD